MDVATEAGDGAFRKFAASASLTGTLAAIGPDDDCWVIVVRNSQPAAASGTHIVAGATLYALRADELRFLHEHHCANGDCSLAAVLDAAEWTASRQAREGQLLPAFLHAPNGPASFRIIDVGMDAHIREVLEQPPMSASAGPPPADDRAADSAVPHPDVPASARPSVQPPRHPAFLPDSVLAGLDHLRNAGSADESPDGSEPAPSPQADAGKRPPEIDITLSAETADTIQPGVQARVHFQVEVSAEAMPLAVAREARARTDLPIMVLLSVENGTIEIVRTREFELPPPQAGAPRSGFFVVKGVRPGACRLAVRFRQGGSELGVIGLAVEVTDSPSAAGTAKASSAAEQRDFADDDKLALLVEQRHEAGRVFYDYTLHSEKHGLAYRKLQSKALLDAGNGPATTMLAFVERIYQTVTQELKSHDDLGALQRETRALGMKLCEELLAPDVAKLLWGLRDRLTLIQIVSWEPYVPWELVRLQDPESKAVDERFLCEYGMVRTLPDEMPALRLPMQDWAYLGAQFPNGSFPPVGAELDYFSATGTSSLRKRGIEPTPIDADSEAFYRALESCSFDVLHIAGHAQSSHQAIERASLVIADELLPGQTKPRLREVDALQTEAAAQLRQRRPLVFLNACETGRAGVVLTNLGGWPNTFLRQGAGAFVGTSWAVRDKPAAAFATAFYDSMLDGHTLAEAASAARTAAKALGDASWLAFKVYGHPRARRGRAAGSVTG